jgi:hypothetical protein
MGQPELNPSDSVGPIHDPAARRVCSLSGITSAREKVISLRRLRDGLDISIRELASEQHKGKIVNRALMVTRFTKATCDAFLGMAAGLAEVFLPKTAAKAANAVEKSYGAVIPLAEAAATSATGGKVDLVKAGAASIKKGVSLVTDNKGYEILTKSTVVKVQIVNSAMNKKDPKGLVRTAADYLYDLNTTILGMASEKTKGGARDEEDRSVCQNCQKSL